MAKHLLVGDFWQTMGGRDAAGIMEIRCAGAHACNVNRK